MRMQAWLRCSVVASLRAPVHQRVRRRIANTCTDVQWIHYFRYQHCITDDDELQKVMFDDVFLLRVPCQQNALLLNTTQSSMCNIFLYLRSTEELADNGVPSLIAFAAAHCHELERNLFGEESPWHAAGVRLVHFCRTQRATVMPQHLSCCILNSTWRPWNLGLELPYRLSQGINTTICVIIFKWLNKII